MCGHNKIRPKTAVSMNVGLHVMVSATSVDPAATIPVRGAEPTSSAERAQNAIPAGASANEASITGEPLPVAKDVGDKVFAGTILENGTIQLTAEKVGEDTTFGKIIELVEEAQDSKSQAERFIDRFSRYYTPAVLALTIIVWLATRNVEMAITILVLGCPGALVIGVPVSSVSGIGNGARNGILFKGSEVISRFGKVDTILFDKTGTLTYGNPQVARTLYYVQEHQLVEDG